MAVNFYLNGFIAPSITTGLMAIGLLVLMVRNISCRNGSCTPKYKNKNEEDKDDN